MLDGMRTFINAFFGATLGKLLATILIAGFAVLGFTPESMVAAVIDLPAGDLSLVAARIVFLALAVGILGLWFWSAQPKRNEPIKADIRIDQVIDHIVNDTGLDLPTHGFVDQAGKTTLEGAEWFAAIRSINEAAAAGRVHLSGRRQREHTHSMPSYDDFVRPISVDYWAKAKIKPWHSFDENGWPQTEILVTSGDWVPTYKGLCLSRSEVMTEWPQMFFLKRWARIWTYGRIGSPLEKYSVSGQTSKPGTGS